MKMRLKCEDPNQIVFTVTTTATAAEWGQFRDCLDDFVMKSLLADRTLVYAFRNQINDLLAQARKIYWPDEPKADKWNCVCGCRSIPADRQCICGGRAENSQAAKAGVDGS